MPPMQPNAKTITLAEIAATVGGTVIAGDPATPIASLAGLEDAGPGDLSFFENPKYRKAAAATRAQAMLVKEKLAGFEGAQVAVPMPYLAFMQLVSVFYPAHVPAAGVHPTALVDATATVAATASVGPRVVVEAGAMVGERAVLMAGAYVGRDCVIADECVLYPNVVIWERSRVGKRSVIHAGSVIGDDGFGYQRDASGHRKIPHVGHVEIGEDVEIGSNCTIDRGTFGRTTIGNGTKIDNLVHLAHNVQIGERTLLIAQVGIAGSSRVGNDAIVAGQAGIADHAVVGDGAIIIPQSAIPKRAKGGGVYGGSPAMPYKDFLKASGAFRFLPALFTRVRAIEKKLGIAAAPEPSASSDE